METETGTDQTFAAALDALPAWRLVAFGLNYLGAVLACRQADGEPDARIFVVTMPGEPEAPIDYLRAINRQRNAVSDVIGRNNTLTPIGKLHPAQEAYFRAWNPAANGPPQP